MNKKIFAFLFISLSILGGCVSLNPPPYYPQDSHMYLYNDVLSKAKEIQGVTNVYFNLWILQDEIPNAYALIDIYNNQYILLTDSLVRRVDEKDLYCILAHEVAHLKFRHQIANQVLSNILSNLLDLAAQYIDSPYVVPVGYISATMLQLKYSRSQELEADKEAVTYLHLLKKGPKKENYIMMLQALKTIYKPFSNLGGLFSDHPTLDARIQYIRNLE